MVLQAEGRGLGLEMTSSLGSASLRKMGQVTLGTLLPPGKTARYRHRRMHMAHLEVGARIEGVTEEVTEEVIEEVDRVGVAAVVAAEDTNGPVLL